MEGREAIANLLFSYERRMRIITEDPVKFMENGLRREGVVGLLL